MIMLREGGVSPSFRSDRIEGDVGQTVGRTSCLINNFTFTAPELKGGNWRIWRAKWLSGLFRRGQGGDSMALTKGPQILGPFSVPFSGALFVLLYQD